jgi:putative transposase
LDSDRVPKFVIGFKQTLWRRMGTRLTMSSSRHPETDGLTELGNITFRHLLRYFWCYDDSNWTFMLPQVELVCNATSSLGIEHTSFEANLNFFT